MAKVVLVTGGGRGIGRAVSESLAGEGYWVVVHYNQGCADAEETAALVQSKGARASLIQCNLTDRASTAEALQRLVGECGVPYGVVLNAGIAHDAPLTVMDDAAWDEVLSVNLGGFYNVVRPLLPLMVESSPHGRIVTMASVSGILGNAGQVNYSAAKAGLIGATKALAREVARKGLTVNCVAPGFVKTDMTADVSAAEIVKLVPMRRMGRAEEVAAVVRFLLSEEASYVTGQVIGVNGGII